MRFAYLISILSVAVVLSACGGGGGGGKKHEFDPDSEKVEPQSGLVSQLIKGKWMSRTCIWSVVESEGKKWQGSNRHFYTFDGAGNSTFDVVYYEGDDCKTVSDKMNEFPENYKSQYSIAEDGALATGKVSFSDGGVATVSINGDKMKMRAEGDEGSGWILIRND